MKKILSALLIVLSLTLSCKKKENGGNPLTCENKPIIGKWLFVERKITNFQTGLPSTRTYTSITTKFDATSYIEFTNSNTYRWYEIYNSKLYRDDSDLIECWQNNSVQIFRNKSERNTTISEQIKELTSTKLVFQHPILGVSGVEQDLITTELRRAN